MFRARSISATPYYLSKANIIQIPADMQRESNFEDASLPPKLTKDVDLAAEAAYAKLSADHEALTKRYADFLTRFERLEDSHEQLLSHSKKADRELEAFRSSNNDSKANFISRLQAQVQEQNDLIATQEQQMETDRVIKERDQKELASLRPAAAKLLECEDKLKELKNDVATLTKKANMVDHFKGKLEQQKSIEKENESLRWRIDVLEDNQKAFDKVHEENQKHVVTATEYEKRFASYENDVLQLSNQRRNLEEELRNQYDEVARLQSRQQHDEKFIESLQEQIRTNTAGPPPSPGSPRARQGALSLEQELEQSEDSAPNYSLENSRLKAEIQILKSTGAGTANANLRIELEEAERIRKRLEENLRDLTEKHAIGQMQLNAMISNSSGEKLVQAVDRLMHIGPLRILTNDFYRNEAVMSTRKLYLEANQELTSIKSILADVRAELSSRDRELLAARADCMFPHLSNLKIQADENSVAAIDKEEIDALEDLKATNAIVTTSFKNDLLMLQNKHKALTTDHEQQKTQLIDALLTKDRLIKDLASLKEGDTGANGSRKAQTKAIIEEEDSRRILQEVSKPILARGLSTPSKKRRGFLKTLSRLSFFPSTSSAQAVGPMLALKSTLHSVDVLGRDRSAINHVQAIPHDPPPFFRAYPPRRHDVGSQPTPKTDQAILESLELSLQRERSVFGGFPTISRPLISPRMIPLPPSPTQKAF